MGYILLCYICFICLLKKEEQRKTFCEFSSLLIFLEYLWKLAKCFQYFCFCLHFYMLHSIARHLIIGKRYFLNTLSCLWMMSQQFLRPLLIFCMNQTKIMLKLKLWHLLKRIWKINTSLFRMHHDICKRKEIGKILLDLANQLFIFNTKFFMSYCWVTCQQN